MRSRALSFPTILCVLILAAALLVSLYSGYRSAGLPVEAMWPFSPLGFLLSFKEEYLELISHSSFGGQLGFTLDYLRVFLFTCLLESPFYYLTLRGRTFFDGLAILLLANFLTHPIVFFVFPAFFDRYVPMALSAEVFAASGEMLLIASIAWLRRRGPGTPNDMPHPALCAMLVWLANLFSWQMGIFV